MLDVNVLISLIDEANLRHLDVAHWFNANYADGWLTCPLTQNGCVRILSQPRYPGAISLVEAGERLRTAISTERHQFLADDISILDDTLVDTGRVSGHRQLTDVYLLALAVAHDARLVTLDTRIPISAVRGATGEHLVVI